MMTDKQSLQLIVLSLYEIGKFDLAMTMASYFGTLLCWILCMTTHVVSLLSLTDACPSGDADIVAGRRRPGRHETPSLR